MSTVEVPVRDIFDEEVYIEVSCNYCQKSLEASWWNGELIVDPCEYCRNVAYEEGYKDGEMER